MRILLFVGIVLLGGLAGFGWAKLVGCPDGGCPLTATPRRGAVFGLFFGLLAALSVISRAGAAADAGTAESTAILHPKDAAEFAALVGAENGRPVLVDFYADWCGPCRQLAPTVAAFAEAHRDAVGVVKVNVDTHQDLAQKYGITSIPALCLFRAGKLVKQSVGAMSSEQPGMSVAPVLDRSLRRPYQGMPQRRRRVGCREFLRGPATQARGQMVAAKDECVRQRILPETSGLTIADQPTDLMKTRW